MSVVQSALQLSYQLNSLVATLFLLEVAVSKFWLNVGDQSFSFGLLSPSHLFFKANCSQATVAAIIEELREWWCVTCIPLIALLGCIHSGEVLNNVPAVPGTDLDYFLRCT